MLGFHKVDDVITRRDEHREKEDCGMGREVNQISRRSSPCPKPPQGCLCEHSFRQDICHCEKDGAATNRLASKGCSGN